MTRKHKKNQGQELPNLEYSSDPGWLNNRDFADTKSNKGAYQGVHNELQVCLFKVKWCQGGAGAIQTMRIYPEERGP